MKKWIALLLAAVMLVCSGCGEKTENELVGHWVYSWELSAESDITLDLDLTIQEDGTFVMEIHAAKLIQIFDRVEDGLDKAGENISQGVDQILNGLGIDTANLEKIMDYLFPEDKQTGERKETATIQGRCKTEDGKLYLSLVKAVGVYGNSYLSYTLEGDTLTLSLPEGDTSEIGKMLAPMLPMTLQKAE